MSQDLRISLDLDDAVSHGVIGEDQAIALRNLEAQGRGLPLASEEPLGITSLNDLGHCIFVALAGFTVGYVASISPWTLPVGLAALWWIGLRLDDRSRLPLAKHLLFLMVAIEATAPLRRAGLAGDVRTLLIEACWAITALLWWWRFRLPVLFALGVGMIALLAATDLPRLLGASPALVQLERFGLAGLIAVLAFLWDASDVRRQTQRSVTGFWLHAVAVATLLSGFAPALSMDWDMTGAAFRPALMVAGIAAFAGGVLADRRIWLLVALVLGVGNGGVAGAVTGLAMTVAAATAALCWTALRRHALACLPVWLRAQLPRTDVIQFGRRPTQRWRELRPRDSRAIDALGGTSAFTDGVGAPR